jgi:hypothetical protein
MSPENVIDSFIKDFVQDLHNNSAAIFAGAGLSKGCGYVHCMTHIFSRRAAVKFLF